MDRSFVIACGLFLSIRDGFVEAISITAQSVERTARALGTVGDRVR